MADKEIMIVERVLSPPMSNTRETIYSGDSIPIRQIPNVLKLNPGTAGNYWYGIYKLEKKDNRIIVSHSVYRFDDILRSEGEYNSLINLPLEAFKKSLKDLLG